MRWRALFAVSSLLFACDGAIAQSEYRLQPGDTVQVWVAQEEDLRRDVVIGPDGWLSFPLAGHVKGEGLSVTELEAALSERLRVYFKDAPTLTVMLRPNPQHQPIIYLAGEVMTPGAYPYRAGMTVLHGVAVAGGLYRTTLVAADEDRAVIVERESEQSRSRLKELSLQIARLQAELSGASTFSSADVETTDPLFVRELQLFQARRKVSDNQQVTSREMERLAVRNAEALRGRFQSVTNRIELVKRRLESTAVLVSKGALQARELFEMESELSELEGSSKQLSAEMAAAEREHVSEKSQTDNLLQERHAQLLQDLAAAQREQQVVEASLADSKRIMAIYDASADAGSASADRKVSFRVLRTIDGEVKELEAVEMTPIVPGDLVRVLYGTPVNGVDQRLAQMPDTLSATGLTHANVAPATE